MKRDYYFPIKLDLPILKPSISLDSLVIDKQYHNLFNINDVLNPEIKLFFFSRGLRLNPEGELFYSLPYQEGAIHIDLDKISDIAKMNWVFGGEHSTMNWYKPLVMHEKVTTSHGYRESIYFDRPNVELVESFNLTNPTVVQVGIPHNSINYAQPRYCLSLVFVKNTENYPRLTMVEAYETFNDLL